MLELGEIAAAARGLGADVQENEPMSRHTTFCIGGPSDLFVSPADEPSLASLFSLCVSNGVPVFPLGNGSNLLVSDAGIRGVVLETRRALHFIRREENDVVCGAGAKLSDVCLFASENALSGLEFAYGIPGSAGGAVFMNAGAYGGEMKDVVRCAGHLSPDGAGTLSGAALEFGYRHSAYSAGGRVITSATFSLAPGEKDAIREKMRELMARRVQKQPLDMPSAGSVFKRPPGHYAGTLIEQCGLKGRRVGGAMVSEKHAGFIVNAGGATCEDVRRLIGVIQRTVKERAGVELECEVRIVGG